MPIYEFSCNACDNEFEELFPISALNNTELLSVQCPKCSHKMKSKPNVSLNHFKLSGSCWEKDGYSYKKA